MVPHCSLLFRSLSTALALAALAPCAAQAELHNPQALAPAEPQRETRFGMAFDDSYRWMEQPERAETVKAWLAVATQQGVDQLARLPARAAWSEVITQAMQPGTQYGSLVEVAERLFMRRTRVGEPTASLIVRTGQGPAAVERVLFDPTREPGLAINRFSVAPDGRTVAVLASRNGGEVGELRFLDVASGRERGTRFGPVWGEFMPRWLDGEHLVISRMGDGRQGDPMQTMVAYTLRLGAQPRPVFGTGLAGSAATQAPEFPVVAPAPGTPWTLAYAGGARVDVRLLIAPTRAVRAGRPHWRPLAGYEDQVAAAVLRGNTLYLLSTKARSSGQVLALPLDRHGRPGAPQVVAEGGEVAITSLEATADGLYLTGTRDGVATLRYLPGGRGPGVSVPLPFDGAIESLTPGADGRSLAVALVGWTQPRSHFRTEGARLVPLQVESQGWGVAQSFRVSRSLAHSADGSTVPLVVLSPAGTDSGPRPTLLEAYGSYGVPTAEPLYMPQWLAWVARGHHLAFCGTRGGNERGRDWHEGGRSANKPKAHADYIACAEALIQQGLTTPAQLAATGTSAGGLLAPVAALQRPELFRALVPRVGIVNASRLEAMANGPNQFAEMGDPTTEAGFKALVAQDALLALQQLGQRQPRVAPPHLFITLGLNDRRVDPWMPAKFAAQALAQSDGQRLVFVRADGAQGHGMGSQVGGVVAEMADTFSFLEAVLGPSTPQR